MTPLDVLYVDDDEDIAHIVKLSLSLDSSVHVRLARSGQEALSLLAAAPLPDVAVLDVMMPGMTGLALLAELRARPATAQLPVIFMTARSRPADLTSYCAGGALGVILKPFDPTRLASDIRALLEDDRAQRANASAP